MRALETPLLREQAGQCGGGGAGAHLFRGCEHGSVHLAKVAAELFSLCKHPL